jgi:hypothetical protein
VDTHELEREVRHRVEDEVGRPLTDDEWEWLKRRAADASAAPPKPTQPTGPRRSKVATVGMAIGWVLERLLLGGIFVAVMAGVAWAFQMDRFAQTNDYGALGWLGTSFVLGFLLRMNADPRWAWGIVGVIALLGLVAMAIGGIIRVA